MVFCGHMVYAYYQSKRESKMMSQKSSDQKSGANVVVMRKHPLNRSRAVFRARLTLLVLGALVVIVGVGVSVRLVLNTKHQASETKKALAAASSNEVQKQQYAKNIQDLSVSTETDKTGILRVQIATAYDQGDYDMAIKDAQQLLAIPNQDDTVSTLLYLANSYKSEGQSELEKQTLQKIVAYYDAHPDQKAHSVYDQVKARL
jgi:tetratricopeptide (TPR) repeat protein